MKKLLAAFVFIGSSMQLQGANPALISQVWNNVQQVSGLSLEQQVLQWAQGLTPQDLTACIMPNSTLFSGIVPGTYSDWSGFATAAQGLWQEHDTMTTASQLPAGYSSYWTPNVTQWNQYVSQWNQSITQWQQLESQWQKVNVSQLVQKLNLLKTQKDYQNFLNTYALQIVLLYNIYSFWSNQMISTFSSDSPVEEFLGNVACQVNAF